MAREYQIWNRGDRYYDTMLAQLMADEQAPEGTIAWDDARRRAKTKASGKEDLALKGALGRSRKLGEREQMPKGAYALAMYPGLQSAVEWAATGNLPGGSASVGMWLKEGADMKLREENSRKRREWAANQRALVGGW